MCYTLPARLTRDISCLRGSVRENQAKRGNSPSYFFQISMKYDGSPRTLKEKSDRKLRNCRGNPNTEAGFPKGNPNFNCNF